MIKWQFIKKTELSCSSLLLFDYRSLAASRRHRIRHKPVSPRLLRGASKGLEHPFPGHSWRTGGSIN